MSQASPVRVAVIGSGFGEKVVAAAFGATEGCRVVDVVSARDAAAVEALCRRKDVDLVSVHSPPFLHLPHVRLAIESGHAVLCDKPFGRDAAEAAAMCDLAKSAGVVNLLNFEFRYDAERALLRELSQSGAVGVPEYFSSITLLRGSRRRPYGWLCDRERGGGWLAALGSHMFDFARWSFGEIDQVSGTLRTAVAERPDSSGRLRPCTAEDGFTALLRSESGVAIVIDSTQVAPVDLPPRLLLLGSEGAAEGLGDRIAVTRRDGDRREHPLDHGGVDPIFAAMQRFAAVARDAVREGRAPAGAPTFADGLACVELMDRIRFPETPSR